MSPEQPRIPDRPALGESWVIASTASLKEKEDPTKAPNSTHESKKATTKTAGPASESLTSSSSSSWTISGPELIMPSICETPNPEGSWVEYVRGPKQQGSESMRKRRKVSIPNGTKQREQDRTDAKARDAETGSSTEMTTKQAGLVVKSKSIFRGHTAFIRKVINAVLIAIILHLLVLPELVYQAKDLCDISHIKTLYPNSCITFPTTYPPHSAFHPSAIVPPEETLATSQRQLESILDTALETLTPLSTFLKQSESMLADLESQLKSTYPDVRNALDLEFTGSNQAVQTAVWEFDSLRADLRSAIESLLASRPATEISGTAALDTRLAIQMRRREEYLDRLRAQIRSKADSLNTRFTTLDDHLEAVDGIVAREERRRPTFQKYGSGSDDSSSDRLYAVLDSLPLGPFGAYLFRGRSSGNADANPVALTESSSSAVTSASTGSTHTPRPAATLALLRVAATHHRPVADSVLRLSRQLGDQRATGAGSTW
ncbi:uncharacterized protein N7479_000068 [Penicillium vulpinum]|uniref:Uncharacterized protein n=1 Tax=Penicillium vulpinum TaxID=29845 RepID=A0A1V6RWL4_9EURO|nr:uncharacterized protein N7479_000068 [Penicillium vulpinum]KAJ5970150.1 hypothetical protein N7479_000068 [Penicillium vulpinum]OQE06162.1 hypothetical protein PENVUL_c019G07138 [Penicillium vulpinum]